MGQCSRNDIQEKLAAALWPADFPDAAGEIEEHVSTCAQCRDGLAQLRLLDGLMKKYRNELSDAVSPCPSSEVLVDFALGTQVDPSTEAHINECTDCLNQVSLVREITRENLAARHSSPTLEEKALIRKLVEREYGTQERHPRSQGRGFFRTLAAWAHFPSLAMGAVAVAVLIALLLPATVTREPLLHPIFSEVQWNTSSSPMQSKRPLPSTAPAIMRDSVALIIFVSEESALKQEFADKIYEKLVPSAALATSYLFISPKELKERLSDREEALSLKEMKKRVFDKTDARYLLAFQISSSPSGLSFNGTLFQRNSESAVGGIQRTGLPKDSMPARMNSATFELLADAEIESLHNRPESAK